MYKRVMALAMVIIASALVGCTFVASDEVAVKKADFEAMKAEIKRLKETPPMQVVQGITKQECTAIVADALKNQCVGKTETVTKTITKYRDRPVARNQPQRPAQPAPCPSCAPPPVTAQLPPPPSGGTFWGWVHPEATAANKKPCFADRPITGMPIECSSVQLFASIAGETEQQWNARVAAANGIAVGAKTDKGTISSTQFGRVIMTKP